MLFNITFPFVLAFFIAYLVHPAVEGFEKTGLKKNLAIIFVYIIFFTIFLAIFMLFFPHISKNMRELAFSIPQITLIYKEKINTLLDLIVRSGFSPEIKTRLLSEFTKSIDHMETHALSTIKKFLIDSISFVPAFLGFMVSIIIAFYYIRDFKLFQKFIFSLIPSKYKIDVSIVGSQIHLIMKHFVQGQLLTSLIVACLEIIGLSLVGIRFPFFLGLLGGMANVIPFFGPFFGAIPAVIIATSQSPTKAMWTILVFLVVQQIDNVFISPKIIEGKLGLHPIVTIFLVIVGGELFGMLGMLLSVPIFAALKVIVKRVIERIV